MFYFFYCKFDKINQILRADNITLITTRITFGLIAEFEMKIFLENKKDK